MIHNRTARALLASAVTLSPLSAADKLDASFSPPGGLPVDSVPVFIVLGFDDNRYADGFQFVLDLLKDKKNPAGTGNPATFDGADIKAVFYHTSGALDNEEFGGKPLLDLWKEAVKRGHEVGCHTVTHNTSKTSTLEQWKQEISGCNQTLIDSLQLKKEDIAGFRTPYLDFNDATFTAVAAEGLKYECTMTLMQDYNKGMFYWPFTLDNGFPKGVISGWEGKIKIPGLWELPVYTMNSDPTMWPPITGFDSSILTQANGKDYEAMLKQALDYRLKAGGNRAPLTVGLHTDTYAKSNPTESNYDGALKMPERQAALANFIEYALKKPEVRFVTGVQLIEWMKNPTALGKKAPSPVSDPVTSSRIVTVSQSGKSVSVQIPGGGDMHASLFTFAGRKLWESSLHSSGSSEILLPADFSGCGILCVEALGQKVQMKIVR